MPNLANNSYHENEQLHIIISSGRARACVRLCVCVHMCVTRRMRGMNDDPGGQMTPIFRNTAQSQMGSVF